MTEQERSDIRKATMYDFRWIVKQSDKETYSRDELLDLIDTVAMAKDQEK